MAARSSSVCWSGLVFINLLLPFSYANVLIIPLRGRLFLLQRRLPKRGDLWISTPAVVSHWLHRPLLRPVVATTQDGSLAWRNETNKVPRCAWRYPAGLCWYRL